VVDQALQIFGGLGVRKGMAVERLYRHVRAFRIFDGTSEIQKLIIAKDILREQKAGSGGHPLVPKCNLGTSYVFQSCALIPCQQYYAKPT